MLTKKQTLTLVDALNFRTHDEVERFCVEFEIEHVIANSSYVKQKETAISKYLIANEEAKGPMGSALVVEVIEYLLKNTYRSSRNFQELEHYLEKDGYSLTETSIRASLPSQISLVETEDRLVEDPEGKRLQCGTGTL